MAVNFGSDPFVLIPIPHEGNQFANLIEKYAEAVCSRVIPSLDLTEKERRDLIDMDMETTRKSVEEFAECFFETSSLSDSDSEDSSSIGTLQYTLMHSQELNMYIIGLGFAGLYHIFERQILVILNRIHYRRTGKSWENAFDKKSHKFSDYEAAMYSGGYPIAGRTKIVVEQLRLIANVVKHGSSSGLLKLNDKYPETFWSGASFPSTDMMELTPQLLRDSATSLALYWKNFPHGTIAT